MDAHTKPMFSMFLLLSGALMVVILYYYAYPMWAGLGLRSHFTDSLMLTLYRSGSFRNQYAVRGVCLFFCAIASTGCMAILTPIATPATVATLPSMRRMFS